MALVLYDGECAVCRNLAAFAARRAGGVLAFRPLQEHEPLASEDVLIVLAENDVYKGRAAWAFLIRNFPDLKALDWLAARLGLSDQAAAVLERVGSVVKRVCRRCAPPRLR